MFAPRTTRLSPRLLNLIRFHSLTFSTTASHFLPLGCLIVVSFSCLSSGMFQIRKKFAPRSRAREKLFSASKNVKTTTPSGSLHGAVDSLRLGPLYSLECFLRVNSRENDLLFFASRFFCRSGSFKNYCVGGFRREFRFRNMVCSSGLRPCINFGSFSAASCVSGLRRLSIAR